MNKRILTVMAACALVGCHRKQDDQAATRIKPSPVRQRSSEEIRQRSLMAPVGKAMDDIPPRLRIPFQNALACEVKQRPKGAPAIAITSGYVRDLTERLEHDPSIASC